MPQRISDDQVTGATGFYRPPYEGIAAVAWLLGAIIYLTIGRTFEEGIRVVGYAALPMFLMFVLRSYQTISNWTFKTRLTTPLPPWMPVPRLFAKQRLSGETFIGKGFDWEPYHARLMKEISTIPRHYSLDPPDAFRRLMIWLGLSAKNLKLEGKHYIHGCDPNERDLFVSERSRASHTLVLGTNGAGKTRMLEALVAQSISRGHVPESTLVLREFLENLLEEERTKPSWRLKRLRRRLATLDPDDDDRRRHLIAKIAAAERRGTVKARFLSAYIAQMPKPSYGPVFILDPKGDRDLRDRAYATAKYFGRERDFMYFSPSDADVSFRINPLANYTRRTELANRISALLPSGGDSEAFRQFAWRAINVVVEGLYYARLPIQLVNVRDYIEGGIHKLLSACLESHLTDLSHYYSDWETKTKTAAGRIRPGSNLDDESAQKAAALAAYYLKHVKYSSKKCSIAHPNTPIDGLIDVMMHDSQHYTKLISNLIPILQQLTTGEMDVLLSRRSGCTDERQPTSFKEHINRNRIVYINFESLADSVVGSALGSLFIADLTACAAERHHKGIDKPPVSIYVDEAAEMMNDPFVQALNKGRAAGFELTLASQTVADFVSRMGNQAKALQVLGNVNTTIAMRLQDNDSIKAISDKFADTSYEQRTSSKTSTTIAPMAQRGRDFSGSVMKGAQTSDLPLVTPDLLASLPPGHFFGHLSGGRKVKGRVMLLPLDDDDRFSPMKHGRRSDRWERMGAREKLRRGELDPASMTDIDLTEGLGRSSKFNVYELAPPVDALADEPVRTAKDDGKKSSESEATPSAA